MATTKIKEEMVKLIDLSKCTGCRGCQVACKNWNSQPASPDEEYGEATRIRPIFSTTPGRLSVSRSARRMTEAFEWIFRKDGCFHCTDASCVRVCPSGALTYGEKGAVRLNQDLCIGCKYCVIACPFGVPRYDPETKVTYKCTLCEDRITSGMIPACVKACPTGCLSFGLKEQMIAKGEQRVAQLAEKGLTASLYGKDYVEGTHVMYVLTEQEKVYAKLPVSPHVPVTVKLWRNVAKPLGLLSIGAVVGGALLHYMIKGPKHPKEEGGE